ncbi:MAG: hypothetical protein HS130_13080 [Deltaproteobacteria bacterium]|nr:hypothetical protein [Deltaproteobacteria bacterium]MCL4874185.1 hypothetical protein [bacterium]
MRGCGGFTIIELVVLMAVIGLVLAVALPRLAGFEHAALKSQAGKLSTLLRYANESAATKRLHYKVSFDIENGSVMVERSPDGREFSGDTGIRGLKMSGGVALRDLVVEGFGKIETGTVSVVFTPLGAAGGFSVHLEAGKDWFTVKFNPYSGKAEVVEGYA